MRGATESRPTVWLVGDDGHPDFAEAVTLVRATADVGSALPEVIVVAQSRPGVIRRRELERLRRSAPLAGVVSLLGSWCEGETRTGKPAAGVRRLYWYEFPSWWQRQLALREAGRCPEWVWGEDRRLLIDDCRFEERINRYAIETNCWDTAAALTDVLKSVGGETIWLRPGSEHGELRGAVAGIWDGGQLNDAEAARLAAFCGRMATFAAPVVRCSIFRGASGARLRGKSVRRRCSGNRG